MSQKDEQANQKLVVKEKLGLADIYQVNARSILNKATGFIDAYDQKIQNSEFKIQNLNGFKPPQRVLILN